MNYKHIMFFIQYTYSIFNFQELQSLFKNLKSKQCDTIFEYYSSGVTVEAYKQSVTSRVIEITPITNVFNNLGNPSKPITPSTSTSTLNQFNSVPTISNTNVNTRSGKASFYFRVGNDGPGCPQVQTFNDNNAYGPCNNGNGVKYNGASETKYWVAIKNANLHCGKTININYNGNSIKLKVMDKCPGCSDNDIDMSLDALIELTGSVEKACSINTTPPIVSWNFN